MPIYEYACKGCGHEFEELIRGDERPNCPKCGKANVERQLSILAAHTGGAAKSSCPSREMCEMSHRCGSSCAMHNH
jgi:putative FmdB family regulatory protein